MNANAVAQTTQQVLSNLPTVIGISMALVQVIKIALNGAYSRFYPLIGVIVGTTLGILGHLDILVAVTAGLAASGTYELGKNTLFGNQPTSK